MESSNRHSSRGHHKSKEEVIKINKSRKNMRTMALSMFWLAVLSMIFYIVIKFFPFLKSVSFYKKINVSSITYIVLRVVQILIPIIFVLPCDWYKQYIKKITLISSNCQTDVFLSLCLKNYLLKNLLIIIIL